jgi:hypothetical protein
MPGFTAAVSLYKTGRHYRTGNRATDPTAHTVATIRPAEINVPGEVIIIEDDPPWSPPPWGGHTGPGPSSGGDDTGAGEPGGGGGDGGSPSTKDPNDKPLPYLHGCSLNQIQSDAATPCINLQTKDIMDPNIKHKHYLRCTGSKKGNVVHPDMECCQGVGKKATCTPL